MAHNFTWKGVNSSAYGLYVEKITPPVRPATRQERIQIPGRDGYLTVGDPGLGEVMRYAECFLADLTQRDAILAWLRGLGVVVFSTEPTRYCKATVMDQIEFIEDLPGNTLIVAFACQPFRYVYPAPAAVTLTAGVSITNPGTAPAEPVITLTGSGNVTLAIGDKSVDIALPATATTIIIDVPAGFAYSADGTVNLTGLLSTDDWPFTIAPGVNAVGITGTVAEASLLPNWRYI